MGGRGTGGGDMGDREPAFSEIVGALRIGSVNVADGEVRGVGADINCYLAGEKGLSPGSSRVASGPSRRLCLRNH